MNARSFRHFALTTLAGLSLLATGCQAQSPGDAHDTALRLVHASEFGASFIVGPPPDAEPTGPVEVEIWRFSDKQHGMTQAWGWDSSWSRTHIDCQAETQEPLLQRTYLNGEQVQEISPQVGPRAPVGRDHQAEQAYVCNPQGPAADMRVATPEEARAWADAHFDQMRRPAR